jgi:DNA-binding Xre family transcriptional regulator
VIRVRLREAMLKRQRAAGNRRVTYEWLSKETGLSRATLEAMGSRPSYNPRLSTIERICVALECTPATLLEYVPGSGRSRPRGRKS